jgi:hypothetical protein
MTIDWVSPFKIAFEIGMFALGWLLVIVIVAFFTFLTYAVVRALVMTIRGKSPKRASKANREPGSGIITFDKK